MRLRVPAAIGPHEGRELELLLAGLKPVAMFVEYDPSAQFEHYVRIRQLNRRLRRYRLAGRVLDVTYYFPDRHEAQFRQLDLIYRYWTRGDLHFSDLQERRVGRLLGYTERDIGVYLQWVRLRQRLRKNALSTKRSAI
ncbi:MAG: hypothetical protein AB7F36_14755 [Reyranellaceae bacterium]